jgi:hypothetical protein
MHCVVDEGHAIQRFIGQSTRRTHLIRPVKLKFSKITGSPFMILPNAPPCPPNSLNTILGFTRLPCSLGGTSSRSFGVKERAQSIRTVSLSLGVSLQVAVGRYGG